MGDFRDLYSYIQTLTPKIKRNVIRDKITALTGQKLRVMMFALDLNILRGFFLSVHDADNPFVKQNGCNIIGLVKGQDSSWERFVQVKEMMHVFDSEKERTGNSADFEALLGSLTRPQVDRTPQQRAEAKAFWMALAVLCPEETRRRLKAELADEKTLTTEYSVALQLRIPEELVSALFSADYELNLKAILT